MLTRSEEDHLKAVYALLQDGDSAQTKDIAHRLRTKASSVTDMLKKLWRMRAFPVHPHVCGEYSR